MTYVELRKSSADITSKLNEYIEKYHSVTVEADEHGVKVVIWKQEAGNRAPVAIAARKCIGDCLNDIDIQEKNRKSL